MIHKEYLFLVTLMFIQAFLRIMSTLHVQFTHLLHSEQHFNQISTIMIWILTNSHQSGHQEFLCSSKGQFAFFVVVVFLLYTLLGFVLLIQLKVFSVYSNYC